MEEFAVTHEITADKRIVLITVTDLADEGRVLQRGLPVDYVQNGSVRDSNELLEKELNRLTELVQQEDKTATVVMLMALGYTLI